MVRHRPIVDVMTRTAGRFDADIGGHAVAVVNSVLAHPGAWCNFEFEPIDDDSVPPESALFGFLAARGPANPLATVMARTEGKRDSLPQVGIQHQAGTKAAKQLREAEVFGPSNARVTQDHPRRGLVVRWPETATTEELIAWLFPAMRVLSRHPSTNTILYSATGVEAL